ncbi:MAG: porin family protein [Gammaproteobacteria bacterium]|nr:MAG: porin family protein [Gammaproteobacteria bacterium]
MSLKITRILTACLTGAILAIPTITFAGADSGFYIGAGAGDASVKEGSFDESDSAYKLIAGYNIGFIPLIDFAVEGSYVDFGNPGTTTNNVEVTGLDAFGLVGVNFGPVGIFAKAGAIKWDLKTNSGFSDSGTDPAYGIGAKFSFLSFAVRAEYEVFEFDQADGEMMSVSATFTF